MRGKDELRASQPTVSSLSQSRDKEHRAALALCSVFSPITPGGRRNKSRRAL